MRCPGRMVLLEAPLECQLLPVTHTFAPSLFLPSQSTSVCVHCAVTDFFWGAICPMAALSGPLVLRPNPTPRPSPYTHIHPASEDLWDLCQHTHKGVNMRATPTSTSPSGCFTPFYLWRWSRLDALGSSRDYIWHFCSRLQEFGVTLRKQRKEQSFISRNNKKELLAKTKKRTFIPKTHKGIKAFCSVKITYSWD